MTETAHYFWFLPDERTGELRRTRWRMTEEDAKGYPGAVRDDGPGSKEVRHDIGTAGDIFANSPPGRIGVSPPRTMRLLVCGGRHFGDVPRLHEALDRVSRKRRIGVVIEGGATGADELARKWATWKGVEVVTFAADWSKGPQAGPERNQRMLDEGKPDGVLAMPGGRGTEDMVRRAEAAGVKVWRPFG